MEIRSYRRVFDLERRIYRIDTMRLNPGGVPVRGIVYFLAALLTSLVIDRLPGTGVLVGALPWYLRDVAFPCVGAVVLGVIRIEGRPFHVAATAIVRYQLAARHLSGTRQARAGRARWQPEDITVLPDGSDGEIRALRYSGPGAFRVARTHGPAIRARLRWGSFGGLRRARLVTLNDTGGASAASRASVIVLERGAQMTLLPDAVQSE